MEPEASCTDVHGKADGMGPLTGGYCFETTTAHCQKLWRKPAEIVHIERTQVGEVAIGLNGRVWVRSSSSSGTAAIVKTLKLCERVENAARVDNIMQEHLTRSKTCIAPVSAHV